MRSIFPAVWKLCETAHWTDIDRFMEKEYRMKWGLFRKEQEANGCRTNAPYRIDKDALAGLYLNMFEKLDLLYSEEEAKTLSVKENVAKKENDDQEE